MSMAFGKYLKNFLYKNCTSYNYYTLFLFCKKQTLKVKNLFPPVEKRVSTGIILSDCISPVCFEMFLR